jgi:predicted ATPase/tRNA A-37 threonylcarbamoyl transferase component Bud32
MDDSEAQRKTRVGLGLGELSHDATITLDQHTVLDAARRSQGVFAPRQVLHDQFEIVRKIGEGGMGQVYLARDLTLGRRVAIKTLLPELVQATDRARDLQQLRRDATATARLQHPHIVTLYQIGFDDDVPYMVLEYLKGESLATRLHAGPLDAARVREIMVQVVDALVHAHREGVIHRDLKPGNVFITEHGAAKVLDFGVAMFSVAQEALLEQFALVSLEDLEHYVGTTSQVAGTPIYMAPEQLLGQEQDARVDLWACGVLIFELLTGQLPYRTPVAAIMQPPPRLDALIPSPGELWQALLERCLSRDLERRYPSAEALLADLIALPAAPLLAPAAAHIAPAGSFVGREEAMAALARLLDEGARHISVLGMGGVGKTRLARQLAHAERRRWPGGVWFCDLTGARDEAGILRAVAAGLEIALVGDAPADAIAESLRGRGELLVTLDNAEHVAEALAGLIPRWSASAPQMTLLVTSREALGLAEERCWTLEPLALPDEAGEGGAAMELFMMRASEARAGWTLADEERDALIELVRMLDGLPLAIELAAARVASATPSQILSRMHRRFELLRSRRRDLSARQATLRGAIDWSWELLPGWARAALAQLSTFSESFDVDAAEEVVDLEPWPDAPFVMDALEILADKSLLQRRDRGGAARFALLVSVRDYARERLDAPDGLLTPAGQGWGGPERSAQVRMRHARYFARMGQPEALSAIHAGRLGQRAEELENLVSAVEGALACGDAEVAAGAALAAAEIFDLRGPFATGRVLLERVLEHAPALSAQTRLRLTLSRGRLLWRQGLFEEAQGVLESVCADPDAGHLGPSALGYLGMLLGDRGDVDRAAQLLQDAMAALPRTSSSAHEHALFMLNAAILRSEHGQVEQALLGFDEALARARAQENTRLEVLARANIATSHYYQGRLLEAERGLTSALVLARRVGDRRAEGAMLGNLSFLYRQQGRLDEAQRGYEATLALARRVGDRATEGVVLGNMADLARARGDKEGAREGLWAALDVARQRGEPRWVAYWLGELGALLGELGRAGEALELLDEAELVARGLDEQMRLARVLAHRAYVLCLDGQRALAQDALVRAEALMHALQVAPEADLVEALQTVRLRLSAAPG